MDKQFFLRSQYGSSLNDKENQENLKSFPYQSTLEETQFSNKKNFLSGSYQKDEEDEEDNIYDDSEKKLTKKINDSINSQEKQYDDNFIFSQKDSLSQQNDYFIDMGDNENFLDMQQGIQKMMQEEYYASLQQEQNFDHILSVDTDQNKKSTNPGINLLNETDIRTNYSLEEFKKIGNQKKKNYNKNGYMDDKDTIASQQQVMKQVDKYTFIQQDPIYQSNICKQFLVSDNTKQIYLLKQFNKSQFPSEYLRNKLKSECMNLQQKLQQTQKNSSQYISQLFQVKSTNLNVYQIYEYFPNGNLINYLKQQQQGKVDQKQIIIIINLLIESLQYLQEQLNYQQHGRLKMENIFYDEYKNELKIQDFLPAYGMFAQEIEQELDEISDLKAIGIIILVLLYGHLEKNNLYQIYKNKEKVKSYINQQNVSENALETLAQNCLFYDKYNIERLKNDIQQIQIKQDEKLAQHDSGIQSEISTVQSPSNQIQKLNKKQQIHANQKKQFNLSIPQQTPDNKQKKQLNNYGMTSPNISESKLMSKREQFKLQVLNSPHKPSKFSIDTKSIDSIKYSNFTKCEWKFEENYIKLQIYIQLTREQMINNENIVGSENIQNDIFIKIYEYEKKNSNFLSNIRNYKWEKVEELMNNQNFEDNNENQNNLTILTNSYEQNVNILQILKSNDSVNNNLILKQKQYQQQLEQDNLQKSQLKHVNKLKERKFTFKAFDNKSQKYYMIKSITPYEDSEFNHVLKEIALQKYIEYYFYPDITVELDEEKNKNLNISQISQNYLQSFYKSAIKEKQKQKIKIQTLKDYYIVRKDDFFTFYLIYEDFDYSLQEYIECNKHKQNSENKIKEAFILANYLSEYDINLLDSLNLYQNSFLPQNILIKNNFQKDQKNINLFNNDIQILISNVDNLLIRDNNNFFKNKISKTHQNLRYKPMDIQQAVQNLDKPSYEYIIDEGYHDVYSIGQILLELQKENFFQRNKTWENLTELKNKIDDQYYNLILKSINRNQQDKLSIFDLKDLCEQYIKNNNININDKKLFKFEKMEEKTNQQNQKINDLKYLIQIKGMRKIGKFGSYINNLLNLRNKYEQLEENLIVFLIEKEIGNILRDMNKENDAIKQYKNAIKSLEKLGEKYQDFHQELGIIQFKIGEIMQSSEQKGACIQELLKAQQNLKKYLNLESPIQIKLNMYLADTYFNKDDLKFSLQQYQQCMFQFKNIGFKGYFGSQLLEKLATLYFLVSEYENAKIFFEKALFYKTQLYKKNHVQVAQICNNLAETNRKLNNLDQAIKLYERSLDIYFHNEKGNQEQIQQVYNNLGLVYQQKKEYVQADLLLQKCYKCRLKLFGSNSGYVMQTKLNLAIIQDLQGNHTSSISIYDEILGFFRSLGNSNCQNTIYIQALTNKGLALFNILDFKGANSAFNEAIRAKRILLGNDHISLAQTIQNSAITYSKLGQFKKAIQLYNEALDIYDTKVPQDHPEIIKIKQNLLVALRFDK